MSDINQLVVFKLDDYSYSVSLSAVERAVRAVEATPLPKAPEIVTGVINLRGRIVPVLDMRARFGLAKREMRPGDQFIIARTAKRTVAMLVDEVRGILECPASDTVPPENIVPGTDYVTGVVKLPDGMLFIHDLDQFLSLEEEEALVAAISGEDGSAIK